MTPPLPASSPGTATGSICPSSAIDPCCTGSPPYRSDGEWKWSNYTKTIYEHILDGDQELVGEYCKLDCLDTLLVALVWLVHRGDLEVARLGEIVAVIREGLREEEFGGWAEIVEGLEAWPVWG